MASPQPASTASPAAEQPAQAKQPSSFFPLGYKEGFSQWWTCMPAATAEHSVLSFIPYLQQVPTHKQTGKEPSVPDGQAADSLTAADTSQEAQVSANSIDDPYGPRRWRSSMVQLSGDNRALNEFSVERVGEKVENNLVVLHGYGAGLGFFYKNFESLSRAKGWQLYALDLLGMGRSTRPPFKIHAKERDQAVTEAEDWFIDALEEWRVKRKIERFTLMGHSLGGYMAVAYALKYPGRLNKLILASPVGIPKDPRAVDAELTEPSESTLSAEFTESQDATTGNASNNNNNNNNNNGLAARTPPLLRPLPKWLTYLWDSNVSPFSFVRWSGPLGPRLVSGWTSRRFSHLPQPESKALHDYAYSIFRMRGSGEYALSYILAPGAYARKPLINRIHGVGRQLIREPVPASASQASLSSSADSSASPQPSSSTTSVTAASTPNPGTQPVPRKENGIPVVLMYGDHDWMDVEGGHAAKKKIDEERERVLKDASPEERLADRGSAKVVVIKKAGHHIYLDGWEEFNKVILDEMEAISNEG